MNYYKIYSNIYILLIEDSLVYANILHRILKNNGFIYYYAYNGALALKLMESIKFDIIISDIHMEIMDGIEFTQIVRQIKKINIPIVLYSSDIFAEEKALLSGATKFILKPFSIENLIKNITECLHKV